MLPNVCPVSQYVPTIFKISKNCSDGHRWFFGTRLFHVSDARSSKSFKEEESQNGVCIFHRALCALSWLYRGSIRNTGETPDLGSVGACGPHFYHKFETLDNPKAP